MRHLSPGNRLPSNDLESPAPKDLTTEERYRGCLLGGAVGDALGAPIEFLSLAQIRAKFGEDGLIEYSEAFGRIGAITDDTQMTLFTAEGCLRAWHRLRERGICSERDVIAMAYQRWLSTQGEVVEGNGEEAWLEDGWLLGVPELKNRRSPGNTCVEALKRRSGANNSKGCGGIMRVAPIGLWGAGGLEPDRIFDLGSESARITHGHPSGYLSAGFLAVLISVLARGLSLETAMDHAEGCLTRYPDHREVLAAVHGAVSLTKQGRATPEMSSRSERAG